MDHSRSILRQRLRRRHRVRRFIRGTAERPRLSVFRTHKHIYAQIIDDVSGRTLASASSMDKQIRSGITFGGNKDAAEAIGKAVAERICLSIELADARVRPDTSSMTWA